MLAAYISILEKANDENHPYDGDRGVMDGYPGFGQNLKGGERITMRASGEFEVKMNPLEVLHPAVDGMQSGRFSIDKTFRGDLEGTSRGEMSSTMTPVKGSAAYVAIEQFRGTLAGRKGSFVLHHYGVMTGGQNRLIVEVVPDSGT
jgi:hypothetical protein